MSSALKRMKSRNLPATIPETRLDYVLQLVRSYIKDSQHYLGNKKPVTALAAVAYAEGLLDAAKFLDLVEF